MADGDVVGAHRNIIDWLNWFDTMPDIDQIDRHYRPPGLRFELDVDGATSEDIERGIRNPHGLTQQFRFDVGWKAVAESTLTVQLKPEKDLYINMPGLGHGRILSVRKKGQFFYLHVILGDGRNVNRPFNPAKMHLSKEPVWQE
jgi:hypothetical protein